MFSAEINVWHSRKSRNLIDTKNIELDHKIRVWETLKRKSKKNRNLYGAFLIIYLY